MKTDTGFFSIVTKYATILSMFCVGFLIGVLLHYMLYRFSLPVQPFIYVAF